MGVIYMSERKKCKECGEEIKEVCSNCIENKLEELWNYVENLSNEIEQLKK